MLVENTVVAHGRRGTEVSRVIGIVEIAAERLDEACEHREGYEDVESGRGTALVFFGHLLPFLPSPTRIRCGRMGKRRRKPFETC